MNIINLLMPIIGADIAALASIIIGGAVLGAFSVYAIRNLIYAIQGKPIKRWLIRRRTKGEQNLHVEEKDPVPTPTPTPVEEQENVNVLRNFTIARSFTGGQDTKGTTAINGYPEMGCDVRAYLTAQCFENPSVTSIKIKLMDNVDGSKKCFFETRAIRVRYTSRGQVDEVATNLREEQIINFVNEIQEHAEYTHGEFTEEDCQHFQDMARSMYIRPRRVRLNAEELAPNATFIEDETAQVNNDVVDENGLENV